MIKIMFRVCRGGPGKNILIASGPHHKNHHLVLRSCLRSAAVLIQLRSRPFAHPNTIQIRITDPARTDHRRVQDTQQQEKCSGEQGDAARKAEHEQRLQAGAHEDPGGEGEVVEDRDEDGG